MERGSGMYQRIKDHLSGEIDKRKQTMFDSASKELMAELVELKVCEFHLHPKDLGPVIHMAQPLVLLTLFPKHPGFKSCHPYGPAISAPDIVSQRSWIQILLEAGLGGSVRCTSDW